MSLSHSNYEIVREKLAGRFQSSLTAERPYPGNPLDAQAESTSATIHQESARTYGDTLKLSEFQSLPDQEFVEKAYLALLGRQADPDGVANYMHMLQSGASRKSILARLRFSPEGRQLGTSVEGLGTQAIYYRARAELANWFRRIKSKAP